jgi:hypothetical protein
MFRTIAAATIVISFAAFALHRSALRMGPLEEPLLLLFMGTLFLVVGKVFSSATAEKKALPAAQLVERRAA